MLKQQDKQVYELIQEEEKRQREVLEMIPSENYTSPSVLEALGTVLNNKYSEGYPGKRYYQGNFVADKVEILAEERAKKLFGVSYVNVQPLSGSVMNLAVYFALLEPLKSKIMGLSLAFGGHLTHGQPQSATGKFYKSCLYTLGKDSKLDFKEIEKQALKELPDIIVCGFTAYSGIIDFKRFREIADKVSNIRKTPTYLLADISHIAGLVAAGVHPSPVPFVDIVTTTTHKTLRGPRGALIMVTKRGLKKDAELSKKIDIAIIPGLQGGPHDNQTAAIAVCLEEASKPEFKLYAKQIVRNSIKLSKELLKFGFDLVGGVSENHLILIDLSNKKVNGSVAALALEVAGIVVNKNGVPFDTNPPFYPSGIRLGTPAITTRGMKEEEMVKIAKWINEAIEEVKEYKLSDDKQKRKVEFKILKEQIRKNNKLLSIFNNVKQLTAKFPLP